MSFTAVFQKVKDGYIDFVEEPPVKEAIRRILEVNRRLAEEEIADTTP